MTRLGAVLALFGFGSALLHFTSRQFFLLVWADDWQPAFGLIVGGVGAVLLLIGTLRSDEKPPLPVSGPPVYGPPQGGYPPPPGPGQPPIPQQGPPYGPRPPMGPPQQRGPGPQSGPPFGPQGR